MLVLAMFLLHLRRNCYFEASSKRILTLPLDLTSFSMLYEYFGDWWAFASIFGIFSLQLNLWRTQGNQRCITLLFYISNRCLASFRQEGNAKMSEVKN